MATRPYTQRERRLLSEYLALTRAGDRVVLNPRLGPQALRTGAPVPVGIPPTLFSNSQMYADAAVFHGSGLELWEAKMVLDGRGIGQLLEYRLALPGSPDYVEFKSMDPQLRIVCAAARPTALMLASSLGIEVHLFTPPWALDDFASWYSNVSAPIRGKGASVVGG